MSLQTKVCYSRGFLFSLTFSTTAEEWIILCISPPPPRQDHVLQNIQVLAAVGFFEATGTTLLLVPLQKWTVIPEVCLKFSPDI